MFVGCSFFRTRYDMFLKMKQSAESKNLHQSRTSASVGHKGQTMA